mgnify:FL=1
MKAWEKVCHKLLNGMIDYDVYTWPPTCTGLFYQPDRPQNQNDVAESASVNTDTAE